MTSTKETFSFTYVSTVEIVNYLKNIKRNKATGQDDLPAGILKDTTEIIGKPLAFIINLSLRQGVFPNDWKIAKLIPIHKKDQEMKFENYRPISALPIQSKIIEKVVYKRLSEYLDEHHLLSKQQFGFRPKRSTQLATTLFTDAVRRHVDNKNLVGCIYIDFSKAFDTISHAKQ